MKKKNESAATEGRVRHQGDSKTRSSLLYPARYDVIQMSLDTYEQWDIYARGEIYRSHISLKALPFFLPI